MSPRYDAEWIGNLLDTERRLGGVGPEEFLKNAGLRSGDTVVDVGCGPGFMTLPAAELVGPNGRVYAVDIKQSMLNLVDTRAAEAGLKNVTTVFNAGEGISLPDGVADFALCGLVLHYCPDEAGREALVRDIGRMMKPGGRVLFIEHIPQPADDAKDRMTPEAMTALLEKAGFETSGPRELVDRQYVLVAIAHAGSHRQTAV